MPDDPRMQRLDEQRQRFEELKARLGGGYAAAPQPMYGSPTMPEGEGQPRAFRRQPFKPRVLTRRFGQERSLPVLAGRGMRARPNEYEEMISNPVLRPGDEVNPTARMPSYGETINRERIGGDWAEEVLRHAATEYPDLNNLKSLDDLSAVITNPEHLQKVKNAIQLLNARIGGTDYQQPRLMHQWRPTVR